MSANVITSSVGWRNVEKKEENDERVWKMRAASLEERELELSRERMVLKE